MTRMQRWKLALAETLLSGTDFVVARADKVDAVVQGAAALREYAQKSGGLAEPRRIRARKVITRRADQLQENAEAIRMLA